MLDLISHILKFFNTLVLFFYLNMIVPNCLYSPPFLNMVLNKKDVSAMILKPIYCIFHIMLPFLNVSHITQPTFSSPDKPTCFPLDPSQICSHLNLLQFNNRYNISSSSQWSPCWFCTYLYYSKCKCSCSSSKVSIVRLNTHFSLVYTDKMLILNPLLKQNIKLLLIQLQKSSGSIGCFVI